jgi:hypothetical protein
LQSGLIELPSVTTAALLGSTPHLHFSSTHLGLPVIAGVTGFRLYFRGFGGTAPKPRAVEIIAALWRQIRSILILL